MSDMNEEWIDAVSNCLYATDRIVQTGQAVGHTRDRVLGTVEGVLISAQATPGTLTHSSVMTHFNLIWPEEN